MSLWLRECPVGDQGLVRPLITRAGTVILMCDEGGEVWMHPEDVSTVEPDMPTSPQWRLTSGDDVGPGTTRWATEDDLVDLGWDVTWHR